METLNRVAVSRMAAIEPMRSIAAQRQKHAQSVDYLVKLQNSRAGVQAVLRGIARATPAGVQLTSVNIGRNADQWNVSISGSAFGESGADVLLGIDRFFHELPRQLPLHDLALPQVDDVPGGAFPAGMKFVLTFTAPGAQTR